MELKDAVFEIMDLCKKDPSPDKVNGTIGSLKDENGQIVTYQTFYQDFRGLADSDYAAYAQKPKGNDEYLSAIKQYVLEERISDPVEVIGTCGGTGAIACALSIFAKKATTLLMPDVCWPNTASIAQASGLKTCSFKVDDISDLIAKVQSSPEESLIIYINDPAENPTGISLGLAKWEQLIDCFNNCGKAIYLVNDIAYLDYCYEADNKDYLYALNKAAANVLTAICFSASKAFSTYGIRLGALLLTGKDTAKVDEFSLAAQFYIRTTVSNINSGAMKAFSKLYNNDLAPYLAERAANKELLKKRALIFQKEVEENELPVYPYHDGFFFTLKFADNQQRDAVHQRLLAEHLYFVKTNLGIRIAICSIPSAQLVGLGKRIKECL